MDVKEKETLQSTVTGTGIGTARVCGRRRFLDRTPKTIAPRRGEPDVEVELERLRMARERAAEEIDGLYRRAADDIGREEAQIFEIHRMLLDDEDFTESLDADVREGHFAEEAVTGTAERFAAMMRATGDPYLAARAADMRDIGSRLCRILSGDETDAAVDSDGEPYILVADDLTPSETVSMDKSLIMGFVTFSGTPNSHTAILARAMGIPALVGTGTIDSQWNGRTALLDAGQGVLQVDPDEATLEAFARERSMWEATEKEKERHLRSLLGRPARTRSGHTVMLYANIGGTSEVEAALGNGAEGIGLLRSEFLYLSMNDYPTEDALFAAYRKVAEGMAGRRVIIRTLDIGADKQIGYFGLAHEENPALGFRGVRICLAREEIFKTQLRAVLRASAYGHVAIMIPMIVSVDEVRRCRSLVETCRTELASEGRSVSPNVEFGIMIETPAAAIMSEELAAEVDFFSVGTNDLCQYTLAADRQNPLVAHVCEENVDPVLRLMDKAAYAIHRKGGWIGICGELAADPSLTQRFMDMKIDELSVSVPHLLAMRGKIIECD